MARAKQHYIPDFICATAVESGDHLARCMVYMDTNMVRAGAVSHPSLWSFSGYNEIQEPRKRNILIDYEKLRLLIGSRSYDQLRSSYRGWVEEYPGNGAEGRQEEWTDSIAVGIKAFVERVKAMLGFRAKGRDVIEGGEGYYLREEAAPYRAHFRGEKDDIGSENTYFWETNHE